METDYVCSLNERSLQKAKDELREDPVEREGAVQALKEWVERESAWLKSPTDLVFLLNFLRVRKFSQLESRDLLERYWMSRTKIPAWFFGTPPDNERILSILRNTCMFVPLPGVDAEGIKTIMIRYGVLDIGGKDGTLEEIMFAQFAVLDSLLRDENIQVNGIEVIVDFANISMQLITSYFGWETIKNQAYIIQKAIPLRSKKIVYVNAGAIFEAFFNILAPFISEKMKKRIAIHGTSLVSFYKGRDMSRIPDEYLPDEYDGPRSGSLRQILDKYLEESYLRPDNLEFVRQLRMGNYGVDLDKMPAKKETEQASYRKLNVS